MLAIWSLVHLPFLKPAWTSGSSRFTYCWSLAWRILSITLLVCEMRAWGGAGKERNPSHLLLPLLMLAFEPLSFCQCPLCPNIDLSASTLGTWPGAWTYAGDQRYIVPLRGDIKVMTITPRKPCRIWTHPGLLSSWLQPTTILLIRFWGLGCRRLWGVIIYQMQQADCWDLDLLGWLGKGSISGMMQRFSLEHL